MYMKCSIHRTSFHSDVVNTRVSVCLNFDLFAGFQPVELLRSVWVLSPAGES